MTIFDILKAWISGSLSVNPNESNNSSVENPAGPALCHPAVRQESGLHAYSRGVLALGIGTTAAVFSVTYAALLDPYPFRQADRIMRLSARNQTGNVEMIGLNPDQICQMQRVDTVVESVLAMDYHAMTMTGREFPENVNVIGLISSGFQDLGVPATMGRGNPAS